MRRFLPLLAGFACTKAAAVPPAAPSNVAATRAAVPCPADADLAVQLRALWSVPADQPLAASCAPGTFPAPGWAIAAVVDVAEGEAWDRSVILAAADGAAIAQTNQHEIAPWYRSEGGGGFSYQPIDFDGDGVMELVSARSANHGGTNHEWIVIERVGGSQIETAFSMATHYDDGAAVADELDSIDCDAAVTFVPDGKTITVVAVGTIKTRRTAPAPDHCFVGRRVYRLVGGSFVDGQSDGSSGGGGASP